MSAYYKTSFYTSTLKVRFTGSLYTHVRQATWTILYVKFYVRKQATAAKRCTLIYVLWNAFLISHHSMIMLVTTIKVNSINFFQFKSLCYMSLHCVTTVWIIPDRLLNLIFRDNSVDIVKIKRHRGQRSFTSSTHTFFVT